MGTQKFAEDIIHGIQFALNAHTYHPKNINDAVRFWDNKTPYIVHPIWCAMTILTETTLDSDIRINGYKALLWHDILEDTTISRLPDDANELVLHYVQQMTFKSFTEEKERIWSKDRVIRLFKLYDKTSNLLDGVWMKEKKFKDYADFTLQLADDVKNNYGTLNIVKLAYAIATN